MRSQKALFWPKQYLPGHDNINTFDFQLLDSNQQSRGDIIIAVEQCMLSVMTALNFTQQKAEGVQEVPSVADEIEIKY